ncbi:hypothetical protein PDESU_03842 [Pontiella desulfatans]|uniref:TraB/GumN family protein n=1 Tax=Pontiella desulfatans TaxID=2750659 RepID=A0A6C2U5I7_PONDE|nr:TraB/GumN family protein [Pontiella desulfatans]VGO15260.1 hypothetical protein PDESU_03842 [Pontiella desulfatans]
MQTKRSFMVSSFLALALSLAGVAQAKSCLWKATSKNGTLYVQGSSHVLKAENYPLAPAIEAAYSNSTALVLEVDMAEMMSPKTQQLIMGKAMLAPPANLQSVLKPVTYQSLESACTEIGLPIAAIQQFKPWFATMTLTLVKMQQMGLAAEHGLDKHFYEKAKADHKKIIGLESIDYQISLFDSLSDANPDDFVNRALEDLKMVEEEIEKLLAAWETGDMATLDELLNSGFKDYPDIYNRFITARNKIWIDRLAKLSMDDETYMVVVGAGHLPSPTGLLELLRKKGFSLEQL